MSLKLIVRPEAEEDILDAALWYEGREAGLGLELTSEIHAAIERALEKPFAYLLLRKHRMCVESSRDDFHIVFFTSLGGTLSLFSQSCMLRKTNGIG